MPLIEKHKDEISNYVVTQHNTLVEANYSANLTARALKVGRLLISMINPTNADLGSIEVDIKKLKRFLGYKDGITWGRFHTDLKDIAKRLNNEPIEISIGKGETFVAFFIASYTISLPKGNVSFDISPKLKPYLLELRKNYTSYLLINIPMLKSSYSIRLYELLHQHRKFGKRSFSVDDLQKKVGSSYPKYSNFKIKVLNQAQKDLKKHTDLAFAFDEKKNGRKVVGIEFIIFGNTPEKKNPSQLSLLTDAIEPDNSPAKPALPETIIKAMNELGISEQNIAKYLAMGFDIVDDGEKKKEVIERCETLEAYYLEKLELTKHSAGNNKAAGFFIEALKKDWINSKAAQKAKANNTAKELAKAKKELQNITVKTEKLTIQKKELKAHIIAELINNDSILETAYKTVIESMSTYMKEHISNVLHLPIKEQYNEAISISSGVGVYLIEHYPERFKEAALLDGKIEQAQKEVLEIKKKYPSIR